MSRARFEPTFLELRSNLRHNMCLRLGAAIVIASVHIYQHIFSSHYYLFLRILN